MESITAEDLDWLAKQEANPNPRYTLEEWAEYLEQTLCQIVDDEAHRLEYGI